MLFDFLRRLTVMIVLCLAQVLVLNRIQLFHCATPLLYAYFAIIFPRNYPKWAILLWCFSLGVIVDAFSNTPGMAAASMTLIGALQPYLLELFLPRDVDDHMKASAAAMGMGNFMSLATLMILIYCVVFFSIDLFSYFNGLYWLGCVVGSTLLTLILVFTVENIRK